MGSLLASWCELSGSPEAWTAGAIVTRTRSGRFAILPARAIDDARLAPAAVRVLAALSTYADREGWCYPSRRTVAARLGVNVQAVQRQERALVAAGYLQIERRYHPDGAERVPLRRVLYDVQLPPEFDRVGQPDVAPGQHEVDGGATSEATGGQRQRPPERPSTRTSQQERGGPRRNEHGRLTHAGDLSRFDGMGGGGSS